MNDISQEDVEQVAALGIGSNSIRLLVARLSGGRMSTVERLEMVTGLASYRQGASGVPFLPAEAIEKTLSAADNFAQHARQLGAALIGIVATEAVRAAANRSALVNALESAISVPVTIISGEEEAQLGWQTIASGYEQGADLAVIDIGGASTDISVGLAGSSEPQGVVSIKMGSRTLMHNYQLDRPTAPEELLSIVDTFAADMEERLRSLHSAPHIAVVIGGTASVLAEMRYNSLDGDSSTDAFTERGWLADWLEHIAAMDIDGRTQARVPRDRADVIVAGGALLLAILNVWDLHHFYASERNILDGFIARYSAGQLP